MAFEYQDSSSIQVPNSVLLLVTWKQVKILKMLPPIKFLEIFIFVIAKIFVIEHLFKLIGLLKA